MKTKWIFFTVAFLFTANLSFGQLSLAYSGDEVINGVTVSSDQRVFVCFPRLEGDNGIRIGEIKNNKVIPFPSAQWNDWKTGAEVSDKFVRANSLRIGPDGNLWVLDTGSPRLGDAPLKAAAKLVVVDLKTNRVVRKYALDAVMKVNSFVDDFRMHGDHIFITDAGEPALIVLNKTTGKGHRVLEEDPSTQTNLPIYAEGKKLLYGGKPVLVHADQLEISPDGKTLYFQPIPGPLSKIEVKYLLDPTLKSISQHVKPAVQTSNTGGTAIDADGNLYISDVNKKQIVKVSKEGKAQVLIQDERLVWADALWIDRDGYLWIPAAQINRLAAFNDGKSKLKKPIAIYKLLIHAKPFKS